MLLKGDVVKYKSPAYHFFKVPSRFSSTLSNNENLTFTCKLCGAKRLAPFGKITNLHHHLRDHKELNDWFISYGKSKGDGSMVEVDEKLFDFIKFFISSNSSLRTLKDKNLLKIIDIGIKVPSYGVLR